MTDETGKTDPLEVHFAAAKGRATRPGDDLMARILADADAVQAARSARAAGPAGRRESWHRAMFRGIGGWPAVAGLATAAVAGVWIGMSPPPELLSVAQSAMGAAASDDYVIDLDPDATFQIAEGAL